MDDYQKIGVIGKGSFGKIYKLRNIHTGKVEALKKIDLTTLTAKQRKEAEREILFLRSLHHPNLLRYHGSFCVGRNLCIITEYCDLGDLSAFVKSVPGLLREDLILKIFIQILLGVEYLHKKQIIHRDLKLMNVFIKSPMRVKIGDLGIARHLRESYYASTIIGTPFYLSPELCEEKPYNYKSDVWALGCLLYELCLKEPPFRSTETTSLKSAILKGRYKAIPSVYSKEMSELVHRLLKADPRDRPSVEEVLCYPFIKRNMEYHGLTSNSFTLKIVSSSKNQGEMAYIGVNDKGADFITGNKNKGNSKLRKAYPDKSSSHPPWRNELAIESRISQSQRQEPYNRGLINDHQIIINKCQVKGLHKKITSIIIAQDHRSCDDDKVHYAEDIQPKAADRLFVKNHNVADNPHKVNGVKPKFSKERAMEESKQSLLRPLRYNIKKRPGPENLDFVSGWYNDMPQRKTPDIIMGRPRKATKNRFFAHKKPPNFFQANSSQPFTPKLNRKGLEFQEDRMTNEQRIKHSPERHSNVNRRKAKSPKRKNSSKAPDGHSKRSGVNKSLENSFCSQRILGNDSEPPHFKDNIPASRLQRRLPNLKSDSGSKVSSGYSNSPHEAKGLYKLSRRKNSHAVQQALFPPVANPFNKSKPKVFQLKKVESVGLLDQDK